MTPATPWTCLFSFFVYAFASPKIAKQREVIEVIPLARIRRTDGNHMGMYNRSLARTYRVEIDDANESRLVV